MQGIITGLRPDRNFGFLTDETGVERFFHRTAVLDDAYNALRMRDAVTFEPEAHRVKGPRAVAIRKVQA